MQYQIMLNSKRQQQLLKSLGNKTMSVQKEVHTSNEGVLSKSKTSLFIDCNKKSVTRREL